MTNKEIGKTILTEKNFLLKPTDGGSRYKGERLGNISKKEFVKIPPRQQEKERNKI